MKNKIGKIDFSALNKEPEPHELYTAEYFSERGLDIIFVKPSNIKGSNSPDFVMGGKIWEIKSPSGRSKRTFQDDLRKAMRQSKHIIFDLRRKDYRDHKWCIEKLKREAQSPQIHTMLAILGDDELLIIKGKFDIM